MPFESKADTLKNVGKAKIKIAGSKGRGVLGLTNQDKLRLARSGTKDFMKGLMMGNKAKAKKKKKSTRYLSWDE